MIRNVVVGRLSVTTDPERAESDKAQLRAGIAGITALTLPGMLANHAGLDAELRDGGWSFAITNDWVDADSYRNYDLDAEHNIHRQQIVEVCEQVARVQFEI